MQLSNRAKKLAILFVVIAAIVAGVFIYLKTRKLKDFEPQIIAKLQSLVRDGTDSLYSLKIEDIEIDVVEERIGLVNASLEVDSAILAKMNSEKTAPNDIFKISLHSLFIEGLGAADLLDTKTIDLHVLNLANPVIEVFHTNRKYNTDPTTDTTALYQKISGQLNRISVDTLMIKDASLIHHNLSKKNKRSELKNVSIFFKDLLIDSTTEYDTSRFLFAKDALISFKDYAYRTADGLYTLKADSVSISAPRNMMEIDGFSLNPGTSKAAFDKAAGQRKERYDIDIKNISVEKINWWGLLNEENISAGAAELSHASIKVYLNRALPPPSKSKVGNYPHQLLMKLDMPVKIGKINISDLDLSYEEFNPQSGKAGVVYFENSRGTISNITNQTFEIRKDPYLRVSAHSFFMDAAPLQADFAFDLAHYREGKFHVDMKLSGIKKEDLEKLANTLGLFTIRSVNIKKLEAQVDGTNMSAHGNTLLLYDDLKITPLKKDDDKKSGTKQRKFLGFIINTFVLKNENPSGHDKPRVSQSQFTRDTDKSFFNLVWKTILAGILKTVGADPKLAKSK